MGIGINALSAIDCQQSLAAAGGQGRLFHLISFENDLDGIRVALSHSKEFPLLEKHRSLISELLSDAQVVRPGLIWTLLSGDFQEMSAHQKALPPELVYFDFYSSKVNAHLWSAKVFSGIFEGAGLRGIDLFTYSAATSVRVALLMAGFLVGKGEGTHEKTETTHASTDLGRLESPLSAAWLQKLERSHKIHPPDYAELSKGELIRQIRTCPQFNSPVFL
jgi:queuine tRNA-ribosyltransferase